jgi:hypothetical protein
MPRSGGNLVELIKKCAPYIGEVQVADVPGRCEPGTGEINYPRIAQALREIGYHGTVGLEGLGMKRQRAGAGTLLGRLHHGTLAIPRRITSVLAISRPLVRPLETADAVPHRP